MISTPLFLRRQARRAAGNVAWATPVALLFACQVFDQSLYLAATDGAAEDDGHHEGETDGEGLALNDECTEQDSPVPILESSDAHRVSSTEMLGSEFSAYPGCATTVDYRGPDAFFALEAGAGDRWHIAVTPEDESVDAAIVVLGACDPQACLDVMDRCGAGDAEEITIVADQARTFLIGVDSVTEGVGTPVDITAIKTQCGDGVLDHGEACEDGNLDAGDGCDPACRIELADAVNSEVEPNNWKTEGNVIAVGGEVRITGRLGGSCDTDHFVLTAEEGDTIVATLTDGAELACGAAAPAVMMKLIQQSTGTQRGAGTPGGAGGNCPSIEVGDAFNESLPAGEYHLVMAADRDSESFDYVLVINRIPPA